jgi:hypothetical protein
MRHASRATGGNPGKFSSITTQSCATRSVGGTSASGPLGGFASELAELLEYAMKPENSWHLELDDKRDIDWVAEQRLGHEPSAGFAKRFVAWVLSLLPVESRL